MREEIIKGWVLKCSCCEGPLNTYTDDSDKNGWLQVFHSREDADAVAKLLGAEIMEVQIAL